MKKICKKCKKEFEARKFIVHCDNCKKPYRLKDYGFREVLKSIKNIKQRKTLEKWANERIANGCTTKGTAQKLYTYKKIGEALNKPFEKVTKKDLTNFFTKKEYNKLHYKKEVKHLFKWINGGDEFPDSVKWIKLKRTIDEIPEEHKALTDEELQNIIENTTNQRDKTIFMIFADNPTRPKDIMNLKIKNVIADEYGFILKMRSKTSTGVREVRLINSAPDFRLYWNSIPKEFKKDLEQPLFYQYAYNRFGEEIGWNCMNNALKGAVKRSKVKRKVNLYDFRRTTATNLLRNPKYTPKEVQQMGGWKSIRMLDTYGKVTSDMVNKKKLTVNGLIKTKEQQKEDKLKPIRCPRCETENPKTAIACSKCWLPLKKKIIDYERKVISKSIKEGKPLTKEYVKEILREILAEK